MMRDLTTTGKEGRGKGGGVGCKRELSSRRSTEWLAGRGDDGAAVMSYGVEASEGNQGMHTGSNPSTQEEI